MNKLNLFLLLAFILAFATSCTQELFPSSEHFLPGVQKPSPRIRTVSQAISAAFESLEHFYPSSKGANTAKEIGSIIPYPGHSTKGLSPDTLLYIINFGQDDGFALISANPTVEPLLVITESGHYEGGLTGNKGFDYYMEELINQLSNLAGIGDFPVQPDYVDTLRYNFFFKSKLLQSDWHQDSPFNYLTPDNTPAGCPAVAIGQIMAYYEHPDTLHLTYPGASGVVDFDWASMITHNSDNPSVCSVCPKNAQLMRELGERMSFTYTPYGSGTTFSAVESSLSSIGYSGSTSGYSISSIMTALELNRPVLIGAHYTGSDGHMWVIDGYDYRDWSLNYYYNRGLNYDGSMNLVFAAHDEKTICYWHFNLGFGEGYNGYYINYEYTNCYGDMFVTDVHDTITISIFNGSTIVPNENITLITNMAPVN